VQTNQRKNKRFRALDGAFVAIKPSDTHVGRLIDISMGGLAFDYVIGQELPRPPTELEVFVKGSTFRLSHIPCKAIWVKTSGLGRMNSISKRRCGVRFGKLTEQQELMLKAFIERYTAAEEQ
jgi:hypothetical protein